MGAVASVNNGNSIANGKISRGGIVDSDKIAPSSVNPTALAVHIVGSDLLPQNIEAADRGVYRQSAVDGLPPATIRNYFSKITSPAMARSIEGDVEEGGVGSRRDGARNTSTRNGWSRNQPSSGNEAHLMVKPRLRSMVTFNCMNLARPGYIGRFDCIFCMDVLPHFSRAQRIALIERLHLYLEPGGYLFLSQTEKLIPSNLNFRSETFDGYTFHRKPLAASAAYGR
jgi:chemotaxis methyl-accepting protein methylase